MRPREPFKRKHIHIFETSATFWETNELELVERECKDCGKKQHAHVNRNDWPTSLWALADVEWKDGGIAE